MYIQFVNTLAQRQAYRKAKLFGAASAFLVVVALREYFKGSKALKDETMRIDTQHNQVIICGDCGKQVAFRGCCPKCGSKEWMPAGNVDGLREKPWRRPATQP